MELTNDDVRRRMIQYDEDTCTDCLAGSMLLPNCIKRCKNRLKEYERNSNDNQHSKSVIR